MMNKRVKRISLVLVVMMALSVFVTTALADTLQVMATDWEIPGSSDRSGTKTWTATKTVTSTKANKNAYVETGAKVKNQGAETTYYFVVPSASARTSDRVTANGNYGNIRGLNFSCTQGKRYGLWHQRYVTTLNTDVVQGRTSLFLK